MTAKPRMLISLVDPFQCILRAALRPIIFAISQGAHGIGRRSVATYAGVIVYT